MKKFKSQICTNREQSKKLLELGLKKETADMVIQSSGVSAYNVWDSEEIKENFYPAWSLHRLIELYISVGNNMHHLEYLNYDYLINCIWLAITHKDFPKEYMVCEN